MIPPFLVDKRTGEVFITDPHQFEACEHLYDNPRSALFLGMSLAKTVTALSYLYDMHYCEAAIVKTLVIAPAKVAYITWPDEIAKWQHLEGMRYSLVAGDENQRNKALEVDAEIYIIGVDNLVWLLRKYIYQRVSRNTGKPYGDWLGQIPFDSVLIDELAEFKGRSSERFLMFVRALKLSNVPYRTGMTGTPAPNGYQDLWAQLMLLDGGKRLGDTFGAFCDKYFYLRGNGMIVYEYIPKLNAAKVIAHKIHDIVLTMDTRDKIQLPDMHTVTEYLEFSPFDREVYEGLAAEYVLEFLDGGEATVKTPADLTNKLLQLSGGGLYEDRKNPKDPKIAHEINTVKIDRLREMLDEYPDENFIVVYGFRHELARLKKAFPFARELRKGKALRQDFDEWNAGKIRMLLIHPKGAGHGLNLQFGGRRMVWFCLTWNLGHYLQTMARLLRRGAVRDIFIHLLLVRGTRDEKVKRKVEKKESDESFFKNELKELRKLYGNLRK